MNIFFLDKNPRIAAEMQCDKHVVKMILESAQLLCTAHHVLGSGADWMYKSTHVNHPSAMWARESKRNYIWLWTHAIYLCAEYTKRYGKVHKTEAILEQLRTPPRIRRNQRTPIRMAMPDEFKTDCPVKSYRAYYKHKQTLITMAWKSTPVPEFMYE